jgi:Tol biopolymer transport system component
LCANQSASNSFFKRGIAAAPDGSFLAFASNRGDGGSHIFRVNADGTHVRQLTFGDAYDTAPDISPDQEWIVYASAMGDKTTLRKIPSAGGAAIPINRLRLALSRLRARWKTNRLRSL